MRVGGFGGAPGLVKWLRAHAVTHLVDATHPFAARMSANAVAACRKAGVQLICFTRPPWEPQPEDRWTRVPDIAGAVAALDRPAARVFLAIGRIHLAAFAPCPQHRYLVRLIDRPGDVPLPDYDMVLDRGPFTEAGDRALMEAHETELVVSKNSGGVAAVAKIKAARALRLPVLMIDRPALPPRREVHDVPAVLDWLAHSGTDLGV